MHGLLSGQEAELQGRDSGYSGPFTELVPWDAAALMPLWPTVIRPIFAARIGADMAVLMDKYHRVNVNYQRMFPIFQVGLALQAATLRLGRHAYL